VDLAEILHFRNVTSGQEELCVCVRERERERDVINVTSLLSVTQLHSSGNTLVLQKQSSILLR
jgi:hypothetical protein